MSFVANLFSLCHFAVVEVWQPPHSHQTLELLFLVCQQVQSWLKANKNQEAAMDHRHVAVFHSNSKNPGLMLLSGHIDNWDGWQVA